MTIFISIFFSLSTLWAFQESRGADLQIEESQVELLAGAGGEEYYQPVDPEVQIALDATADILDAYTKITRENQEYAYEDFRSNKLEPAIRKLSEIAKATKNKEVMYSAIALASCDFYADARGSFWSAKVLDSLSLFTPNDIQDIFSRLPGDGRTRVRGRILRDLDPSHPLHGPISKIQVEPDYDLGYQ